MNRKLLVILPVVAVLAISCANTTTPTTAPVDEPTLAATDTPRAIVAARADEAVQALKDRDMEMLSSLVHPVAGVRFTPYAFVQDSDLVFSPAQLVGILSDPTTYVWGVYDGSGLPIEMTFEGYYGRFVYDQDYAAAEWTSFNERIGTGNSIDNSREYYPEAIVVEYHFPGFDPDLAGMDWRSLRLVFQEQNSVWYLVGIIHDEWTI